MERDWIWFIFKNSRASVHVRRYVDLYLKTIDRWGVVGRWQLYCHIGRLYRNDWLVLAVTHTDAAWVHLTGQRPLRSFRSCKFYILHQRPAYWLQATDSDESKEARKNSIHAKKNPHIGNSPFLKVVRLSKEEQAAIAKEKQEKKEKGL